MSEYRFERTLSWSRICGSVAAELMPMHLDHYAGGSKPEQREVVRESQRAVEQTTLNCRDDGPSRVLHRCKTEPMDLLPRNVVRPAISSWRRA